MPDFRWADPMDAYDRSYARTNALFDNAAQAKAGQAFAAGDYNAASATLAKRGRIDAAAAVSEYAESKSDRLQQRTDETKRRTATSAMAGGDYDTARTQFGEIGDVGGVNATTQAASQRFEAQRSYTQQAFPVLSRVLKEGGPQAFAQAIDQLGPDLKRLGMSDDEIITLQVSAKQSPEAFLNQISMGLQKEYEFRSAGDTVLVFDKADPSKPVGRFDGTKFVTLGEGQVLAQVGGAEGGGSGEPRAPAPAPAGGGSSGFDAIYDGFVAPAEGGYTASDGNGAPANFGINQKANPDIDVASLTPERARELYKERYWGPSGAENLPPAMQAVHFDTAVNMGVAAANRLLAQAGDDPEKYLRLREARYRSIAAADPTKRDRLDGWLNRNRKLGEFIGGVAGEEGQADMAGGDGSGGARIVARGAPKQEERWEVLPDGNQQRNTVTGEIKGVPNAPKPEDIAKLESTRVELARKADNVLDHIDEAMEMVGWWTTGPWGQAAAKMPWTQQGVLAGKLRVIKANLGFTELNTMRQNAASGASGLGQITERELNFLQSVEADIENSSLPPKALRENLKRLKELYIKIRDGAQEANFGPPEGGASGPAIPPDAVADLRSDSSPQARAEFDEVFGAGASARVLGGR